MPYYTKPETLSAALQALFGQIQTQAPDALKGLTTSKLLLHLKTSAPMAEVWLNGKGKTFAASYGPSKDRADLDVEMAADVLHQILLDELSMKKAMGNGQIKVKGPVWKMQVVIDIIKAGRGFYPDVLKAQGLKK